METKDMIFVFGSNTGGIHGAGAAHFAMQHRGAQWGVGNGLTGQAYAIPTKGIVSRGPGHKRVGETLPLPMIQAYVKEFLEYAREHPELTFQVTCIGCGLAGLKHEDIAPMFKDAPENCFFDTAWAEILGPRIVDSNIVPRYWGTF